MYITVKSKEKELKSKITQKRYTILDGINLIESLEKRCASEKMEGTLVVSIFDEERQLSKDEIQLGFGDGVHYISYLETKLLSYHKDDDKDKVDEVNDLIIKLRNEYISQYNESLYQSNDKKEIVKPSILDRFKSSRILHNKPFKILAGLFSFAIVVLLMANMLLPFLGSKHVESNESSSVISEEVSSQVEYPPLDELIGSKRFTEALEYYPQEYPLIERQIFYLGVDGIPYLEEFLSKKDYAKGWFDLAYLKKDYVKVVELYTEADSDERLTQLAVAYVKVGMLPEAEALNGRLMVDTINTMIVEEKTKQAVEFIKQGNFEAALTIQAQINNERIATFFEELGKVDAAITDINNKLAQPELKEEERKPLEEEKKRLEEFRINLINSL